MTRAAVFEKTAGHRRRKGHRRLVLFLGVGVASWLVYVVAASTIAGNKLRTVASGMDLTLQHFEARSWFPGHLVLRDLVVTHQLRGSNCRTTVARVDLPHDPLRLVMGDLRISTLTADAVGSTCEFGPPAETVAVGAAPPFTLGMIGITSLAMAAVDASPSEASVIEDPSVEYSVEIERAVVHVKGVTMGHASLVEPFDLTAEGFSVAQDGVRIRQAEAKLASGTVTFDEQTVLDNLSVSLRVSSVQAGPETGAGNELNATLEIKGADVRALPGIGTAALTAVEGTLQANLTWRGARLAYGSSLHLSLNPFTWSHEGGVTKFEKTSVISAEAFAPAKSQPKSVEWQAKMPSVRYHGERGLSATAHDVSLSVRYEAPAMLPMDQPGDFSMRTGGLSLRRGEQVLTSDGLAVEGRLRGSASSPKTQLFDSAMVTLTGARLVGDRAVDQQRVDDRFSAELQLKAAQAAEGYSGNVNMRGQDAGVILSLVNSGELPSWITSKFDGEPFLLEAAVELKNEIVQVSDLEFERGVLRLRGWWRLDPEHNDGALLMEYGGLQIGIGGGQPEGEMMRASQEWLQSKPPPKLLSAFVEP